MKDKPRKYETFEHTADIGLRAWGATLEELVENAAEGLTSIMTDTSLVKCDEERTIAAEGNNIEETFRALLGEIAFLFSSEGMIFGKFRTRNITDNAMEITALGEPFNPDIHTYYTEIKAVTYHELYFKREGKGWTAQVILDV